MYIIVFINKNDKQGKMKQIIVHYIVLLKFLRFNTDIFVPANRESTCCRIQFGTDLQCSVILLIYEKW